MRSLIGERYKFTPALDPSDTEIILLGASLKQSGLAFFDMNTFKGIYFLEHS
jgi:hypothetical protein